jgi:hypothetical protein
MYAHTEPPTRTFIDVSEEAYSALVKASKLTKDSWSVTINNALATDGTIARAYRNGGMFAIQVSKYREEFIELSYETEGTPHTTITTCMTPKGLRGLLVSKPRPPTSNWQTVAFNRALQRWLDIIIARHEHRLLMIQHHRHAPQMIIAFI